MWDWCPSLLRVLRAKIQTILDCSWSSPWLSVYLAISHFRPVCSFCGLLALGKYPKCPASLSSTSTSDICCLFIWSLSWMPYFFILQACGWGLAKEDLGHKIPDYWVSLKRKLNLSIVIIACNGGDMFWAFHSNRSQTHIVCVSAEINLASLLPQKIVGQPLYHFYESAQDSPKFEDTPP